MLLILTLLIIRYFKKRNLLISIRDLGLLKQDFEDGSAFHYALKTSNGYLDVPKYLDMLLNNGANIMAIWTRRPFNQTDTERTTERSLPLNIALEMQYSPDNKNGRTRCDEYFQALNKYGIEKIFNNLEKDPEVRKSFLIEHLTVGKKMGFSFRFKSQSSNINLSNFSCLQIRLSNC